MKSQDSILRLKRFQVEEKARQLARLDSMIGEFESMSSDLDSQISHEEQKAGIDDQSHFAYPTIAKAARLRKENLETSLSDLNDQRAAAKLALIDTQEALGKAQKLQDRRKTSDTSTTDIPLTKSTESLIS